MIILPEIDLTPEGALSLDRFRQLFWTGRFLLLAGAGADPLGATDVQTLYRAMDRILLTASGQQLCAVTWPLTPQERLERAKDSAAELKLLLDRAASYLREWYAAQDEATQAAVLALLVSLHVWLESIYDKLSPEAQDVVASLKTLLVILSGEATSIRHLQGNRK